MANIAETIVDYLAVSGVKTVFGLPGGGSLPFLEALRKKGIEFILVKSESSAVYMADVVARLTGVPGVALVTLGPGATNAYAGIAHAYLDRSPVLLLTAQTDPALLPGHTHQVLDLQAAFRPVTLYTAEVTPENVQESLQQTILALMSPRPGPVHLGMSLKTALTEINIDMEPVTAHVNPFLATPSAVEDARQQLAAAQYPVIVAGLGLEPERPYAALRQLAEAANAPVIDTPKSKGVLPADHPLFAGTIGLTHTDPVYDLLDEADCIIAVGFDVVELVKPWDYDKPLIWIANWENADPMIAATHEFVGLMMPVLGQLAEADFATAPDWGTTCVEQFREANPLPEIEPAEGRILPIDVLKAVRHVMPPETSITTDVGSHKIFTALNFDAREPNRYFVSNGLSCMGFGLPAAIAAAHQTGQPAVCITGDGGLAMALGELGLLTEMQLPVIIVMMNDEALDLIRYKQKNADYPVFGTEFKNPDYHAIATGYGLDYARVQDHAGCIQSLEAALNSGKPTLIEVMVDPVGYV